MMGPSRGLRERWSPTYRRHRNGSAFTAPTFHVFLFFAGILPDLNMQLWRSWAPDFAVLWSLHVVTTSSEMSDRYLIVSRHGSNAHLSAFHLLCLAQ